VPRASAAGSRSWTTFSSGWRSRFVVISVTLAANVYCRAMRRAVVLVSGGLDSATVLAIARQAGYETYALSFRYGQRHDVELECAQRVAAALGAREQRTAEVDLRWIGGSALTAAIDVPKDRDTSAMGVDIPITYVPARNALFLTLALGWAEVLGARDLFAGMNALDYSGYPDCRPEFLRAFEAMANLGTKAGAEGDKFVVHAPLLRMTKAEIIKTGIGLGVDYSITHSCYDPIVALGGALACGRCDSCVLRKKGFAEAGVHDPTRYAARPG
jgi:7-cyano-7-deazaguanine synthase